jgi:phosphoadenosine phosphosulfate reductase
MPAALRREDLVWAKTARFRKQVERAQSAIRRALEIGALGVSYSSGKDSSALLHLVREIDPEVPAAFFDSGAELQSTYDLVRAMGIEIVAPRMTMFDMARYAGWWGYADPVDPGCPFDAKRVVIEEPSEAFVVRRRLRVLAYGLRAGESRQRAKHAGARGELFEGADRTWYCQPIAYWSTADVWAYIASREIQYNVAYDRMSEAGVERESQRVATLLGERGAGWGRHAIMRAAEPERFREIAREFPGLYRLT